ncbi:MAG: hypothetical protein RJB34_2166 [Pseudomonadota bacterium]|jgi:Leucine-rich repeat (LRR) protein
MIKEIIISSMKSKLFMALALGIFLASCGGGGGSGSNAVTPENAIRQGYAVDDYVIGGTVKIYNGSTDVILNETTTGEKGVFSWPSNISGAIRVEITGGKEDVDGSSATLDDQKPFDGKLIAVYFAEKQAVPMIVSAITTGLANASKNNIIDYEKFKLELPDDVAKVFFILSSDSQKDISKKLEIVKKVQRTMGISSIVNELTDDGKINNSNGISSSAIASPIAMAGSAAPSVIEDLALQYCIAEQLGKDPAAIKQADFSEITTLHCEGASVLSLNGIQSLSNLESLTLNNNEISDIKPLQSLTKLYYLNLNNNKIKSLADFATAQFSDVSLDIGSNCISDLSSISDTGKVKVSQYAGNKRQFPNCVKNDVGVKRIVARISGTGAYVLVYITDLNTLANCQIDWGDGSVEQASCDARTHTIQHSYTTPPINPVKFMVNGVVKAQVSFPNQSSGGITATLTGGSDGGSYSFANFQTKRMYSFNGGTAYMPQLVATDTSGNKLEVTYCAIDSPSTTNFCDNNIYGYWYVAFTKASGNKYAAPGGGFQTTGSHRSGESIGTFTADIGLTTNGASRLAVSGNLNVRGIPITQCGTTPLANCF